MDDSRFRDVWNIGPLKRLRKEVARADRMGMRPNVFAKAGDSNLGSYNALYGLGCRTPTWDQHEALGATLARYREVGLPAGDGPSTHVPEAPEREPWNSFSRSSAATRSGIIARHVLEPASNFKGLDGWAADPDCPPDQSLLSYEIDLIRPRWCFILFGSNGASFGYSCKETATQAGNMVDAVRKSGPVPILCSIPPQLDRAEYGVSGRWVFAEETSRHISELARKKKVPYLNLWDALADDHLVHFGLIEYDGGYYDGMHLGTYGGLRAPDSLQQTVDFRPEALRYGNNLRNLLVLKLLRELDSVV